jgi:UDP-2-acetamido-2,6-beta-L-arabino-hexul-4-ose reductase
MLKIGITGQSGFIGTHLFNTLGLYPDDLERIPFRDDYFQDEAALTRFVGQCDTIVHLAAINRHNDPEVIYRTNIGLVQKLIVALNRTGNKPHLLISSSIQEEKDNLYGKSKKEGREMLASWAKKNNAPFTGFVFPNIFGPFGDPYYNSFIATFSYQLNHNETPQIEVDARIPLLFVNEAVQTIMDAIKAGETNDKLLVPHTSKYKVSEILELLKGYKNQYIENGMIPELKNSFEINLFNTFRSYTDLKNHNPVKLKANSDERGSFVETIKTGIGGQFSFSTTKPRITRGNHFHTRKIERFTVIKGKSRIQLRRIGGEEVLEFELCGEEPSYVDMPVWYTHNITNTGTEELYTLFWINEFYDPDNPDTYFEKV